MIMSIQSHTQWPLYSRTQGITGVGGGGITMVATLKQTQILKLIHTDYRLSEIIWVDRWHSGEVKTM